MFNKAIQYTKQVAQSFLNHGGFRKYFFNTGWLLLDKVLRIFLGVFVGAWVARYLGPSNYGIFSYAMSFVGLFSAFGKLGLDGVIIRNIVKEPKERDEILGTSFILKLCGSVVLLLVVFVALQLTSASSYEQSIVMVIAFGQIFMSFEVIDFYFQSQVQAKYSGIVGTLALLVSSVVRVIFIVLKLPLLWFAVVVLLEQLTKAIFFIYFYIKIVSNGTVPVSLLSWKVTKNTVKDLLQDSWPLFLGGAVVMIQARIDQVLIKEMIGNAEVGQYSVAMSLIESFGFIPVVLQNSLFPSIQNAKAHSKKLYEDRLLNFYRLNFLLFLSVAIPIILFGEKIVVLLFGLEYQYAGALLPLMAIRLFFTNMGVARGSYMLSENLTRFSLITLFVGTLTNIILNYLWIPLYEGTGAIGASLISFGVSIFLVDMFYLKTRKNVFLQMQGILTFYKISLRS